MRHPTVQAAAHRATRRLQELRRCLRDGAPFDATVEAARRLVEAADLLEVVKDTP